MAQIKALANRLEEMDRIYPNRHKEIHKDCCKNCPSNNNKRQGIVDPESEEIKKSYSKGFIVNECLFVCAWRPSKLCKGWTDECGIDEKFIKENVTPELLNS